MMNCAGEADGMSLYEYEARLFHWNEAHSTDDVASPDPEVTEKILAMANSDPRLTH